MCREAADPRSDRERIVQRQHRAVRVQRRIGGYRHDVRLRRSDRRLAECGPMHLAIFGNGWP
jgi:hypothetical protein